MNPMISICIHGLNSEKFEQYLRVDLSQAHDINRNGNSLLHSLVLVRPRNLQDRANFNRIAEILFEQQVNPHLRNNNGQRPIDLAKVHAPHFEDALEQYMASYKHEERDAETTEPSQDAAPAQATQGTLRRRTVGWDSSFKKAGNSQPYRQAAGPLPPHKAVLF